MTDKNKLVGKMKWHGDDQQDLADCLGISLSRANAKINGAEFTQEEIKTIRLRYNLTPVEVVEIFLM